MNWLVLILVVVGLGLFLGLINFSSVSDYSDCLQDTAENMCQEKGLTYEHSDSLFGNFQCINETSRDVQDFKFIKEDKEACKNGN